MKFAKDAGALGAGAAGAGAAVTAAIAAACCVGPALAPVFLTLLGAAGLAAVAGLKPYAPALLLISGAMIVLPARSLYRRKASCAVEAVPLQRSWVATAAKALVALAAILWTASLFYAIYGFLHE